MLVLYRPRGTVSLQTIYTKCKRVHCLVLFLKLAKKFNMVIISPILERDEVHGDQLFNTAGLADIRFLTIPFSPYNILDYALDVLQL